MIGRILRMTILLVGLALPAVADEPFDLLAVMAAAQKALAGGDAETAAAIYGHALENPALADEEKIFLHFNRSRMRALQGRSDLALTDADAAVGLAERSVKSAMGRGNLHAFRGMLLAEVGRRDEAITALERALTLLQSSDAEYVGLLAKLEELGPDQAERMRRRTEAAIKAVKDKLTELRDARTTP